MILPNPKGSWKGSTKWIAEVNGPAVRQDKGMAMPPLLPVLVRGQRAPPLSPLLIFKGKVPDLARESTLKRSGARFLLDCASLLAP